MKEDIEKLPYEKLYEKLEKIVNELEKGNMSLEASLDYFERGLSIYKECCKRLKVAEDRLQKIVGETCDEIKLESFDFEDEDEEV